MIVLGYRLVTLAVVDVYSLVEAMAEVEKLIETMAKDLVEVEDESQTQVQALLGLRLLEVALIQALG